MSIETLLASALGGLILVGLGLLLRTSYRVAEKLDIQTAAINDQKVSLAAIGSTLAGVVLRVDALDRWKDQQQALEVTDLRHQLADLKREQPE